MTTALIDEFETLFSKNFGAAKCWRCDDSGAIQSASIVPRFPACQCEVVQAAIEGADGTRKDQPRPGRGKS